MIPALYVDYTHHPLGRGTTHSSLARGLIPKSVLSSENSPSSTDFEARPQASMFIAYALLLDD